MKRPIKLFSAAAFAAFTVLLSSCDWESGSQQNYNASNLAGITNVSGYYRGLLAGGKVVSNPSRGNILGLNIQQSGNRVEVIDNQGSRYIGTVGAPALLENLADGSIAPGATVSTYQISFSGKDVVSARDIEFTGTITLVAVTDIVGNSGTRSRDRVNGVDQTTQQVVNQVTGVAPNTTTTTTTTITTNNDTTTKNDSSSWEYSLTDASTQLRLRGTWVERGGSVSNVDGLAAGIQGNITSSTPGGGTTP